MAEAETKRRIVPKLNTTWATQTTANRGNAGGDGGGGIRFVSPPKVGEFKFRLLPPSPKEDGRIGIIVAKHYNVPDLREGKEAGSLTAHLCLKHTFPDREGVRCPTCDVIELLENKGLQKAVEDNHPGSKSYVKGLIVSEGSDNNGPYNPEEPVVISFSNDYSLTWLLQKMMDPDFGPFYDPYNNSVVKYSRTDSNGKWERSILPGGARQIAGTDEKIEEIWKKADDINLYDIWKFPTDEQMLEIVASADALKAGALRGAEAIKGALTSSTSDAPVDHKAAGGKDEPFESANVSKGNTTAEGKKEEAPWVDPMEVTKKDDHNQQADVDSKVKSQVDAASKAAAVVSQAQKTSKENVPSGAPECFSNDKIYDEMSAKCLGCAYSTECESAIKAQ